MRSLMPDAGFFSYCENVACKVGKKLYDLFHLYLAKGLLCDQEQLFIVYISKDEKGTRPKFHGISQITLIIVQSD